MGEMRSDATLGDGLGSVVTGVVVIAFVGLCRMVIEDRLGCLDVLR